MRRFLFGTFAPCGVTLALACGHQIDTYVAPDSSSSSSSSSSSGSGGPTDGEPNLTNDGSPVADAPVKPGCDVVLAQPLDSDYAANTDGWTVHAFSDAGVTNFSVNEVNGLRFVGSADSASYMVRTVPPGCDYLTVSARFQFLDSAVSFEIIAVNLGAADSPSRRLRISYSSEAKTFALSRLNLETNHTDDYMNVLAPATVESGQFYLLNAAFARNGAIWAAIEQMVNTRDNPRLLPESSANFDFRDVSIGVSSAGGTNTLNLDSITLTPP